MIKGVKINVSHCIDFFEFCGIIVYRNGGYYFEIRFCE